MTGWFKLTTAVYWLALAIWLGAIMAVGVTAVGTFHVLPDPDLGLTLDKFDAYDHDEHGTIAAGLVNDPTFFFVDVVQVAVGTLVLITLALQLTLFQMNWKRPANLVRTACIVIAAVLLAVRLVTIMPEMNSELRAYWSAAEAGEIETAQVHREAFDQHHAIARPMFDITMWLLLLAIASSGVAHISNRENAGERPSLEKPALLSD